MTDYKKTVLITGASRGIGRACAVELARTGHALVLNSRRPSAEMDETVRLCEEAGAEVRTLFFDVGSTEAARTAIEADIAPTAPTGASSSTQASPATTPSPHLRRRTGSA